MYKIFYLIFRVLFIFIASFPLQSSLALSPSSVTNNSLDFIPGFRTAVEKAIQSGLLNQIIGVEEKLEFVEAQPVGDLHVYFVIHQIEHGISSAKVTLSYLIRNAKEDARRQIKTIEVERYQGEAHLDFLKRMDLKLVLSNIDEESHWDEKLFQTQTQCVILKDGKGQRHKVYYKHGKSAVMEYVGAELFRSLGLKAPRIYFSPESECAWIESIESESFESSILQGPHSSFYAPPMGQSHIKLKTEITPLLKELFKELGRSTALLFILGHRDFHSNNFLVTSNFEGYTIDFETLGQKDFQNPEWILDLAQTEKFLLQVMASLFHDSFGDTLMVPVELKSQFYEGIKEVVTEAQLFSLLQDLLLKVGSNNLYTRIIINSTSSYKSFGYTEKGWHDFAVPHYNLRISKDKFLTACHQRQVSLARFVSQAQLAQRDDLSLKWFDSSQAIEISF